MRNALGWARISSQGLGTFSFTSFFSAGFSLGFSRAELDEEEEGLDGSRAGAGRSAAIWFQIRKKLLSVCTVQAGSLQEEGDGHVDPCYLH